MLRIFDCLLRIPATLIMLMCTGYSVDNPKFGGVKKGYAKWRDYLNAFGLGNEWV